MGSTLPWVLPITLDPLPQPPPSVPVTVTPNLGVGSQAQRWLARQRTPSYWGVPPAVAVIIPPVVPPTAPTTTTANQFVGAQAQRWLAKQHAPDYWPLDTPPPPPPVAPVDAMPATVTPNPFVGSRAQRWLAKQRSTMVWPVDTPPSYISPVTPPGGPGLVVRGAYGFIGIQANEPDGTYWRMPKFTYLTDSQFIAMVLGDEGGAAAQPSILYFHCDSSFTQGAFLSITFNSFTLGSFTRTGNTITYTPFNNGSVSMLLLSGQTVGVQNINNAYTVLVNGQSMLEFTGGSVAMGSNFRNAAVSLSRFTDNSGFVWDSYRVAALSLADYVQPTYTGTGARVSRHNATASGAQPSTITGTPSVLTASTFDTLDIGTADISFDFVNGAFIVQTGGWYHVGCRIQCGSAYFGFGGGGNSCIFEMVLYKNAVPVRMGQTIVAPSDTAIFSMWGEFDIDLAPNDTIQLGINVETATLGTWGAVGTGFGMPAGAVTYATISLNNPKAA